MPKPCPACRVARILGDGFEPGELAPGEAHAYAWCVGAAHVMAIVARKGPVAVELCEAHMRELVALLEDESAKPVVDLRGVIGVPS